MSDAPHPESIDALRTGLANRYAIEREIGAGGMAVVYVARDLAHQRQVALKVLRAELDGAVAADRFHREIRVAAGLVHRGIVPLLDSGETAGQLWYTMPYIEGESLRARLDREQVLPVDETVRLTLEVAEALTYAHGKGILHRDIKPDNILLADGHALVADFGIARALGTEPSERLTATGVALGTPAYMSPEQSSGDVAIDARTDLYALGSVCYEMLAGEPPFTGPTAQAVIARRLTQPPPSLRILRASASDALDTVVRRALAPVPADRFTTVREFSRALTATLATDAMQASQGRRVAVWPRVAMLAGAAVLALAVVAYRVTTRSSRAVTARAAPSGIRLAVLPFRLIGGDSTAQYLADGITQEVSTTLANLSGLRVIALGSVSPLVRSGKGMREIGRLLSADALLEGDVQQSGTAVRVHVRLVDPASEESRWTQQYDHVTRDVFKIQSEVATKVAGVLRIQLAERESRSLRRLPTTNPEAYDLYLRAKARASPEFSLAISEFTRAIVLDSTFALAWASRALVNNMAVFNFGAPAALLDQSEFDIHRALALDSTLAIAWKARGDLNWNSDRGWHFPESLSDVRQAIALQPSSVVAHNSLGSLYFHYGFLDEARRELDSSLSLDPRDGCENPATCAGFSRPRLARVLWYRQQFDSALAVYEQMPFVGDFAWEMAIVLGASGRPADGLALLDSAKMTFNGDREAVRGLLYAMLGREREALEHIAVAAARPDSRSHFHHSQFTIACAYARLGKPAEAVEWLRQTAENGLPNYLLFRNDPNLKRLQGLPAYEALMAKLQQQHEAYRKLVEATR